MLTQAQLKELVVYCQERGGLYWIKSPSRIAKVGARAGSRQSGGYRRIGIFGVSHLEHRLVWLYHHGSWPAGEIDHINGVRDDNRIENLRDCSRSQNMQNRRKCHINNKRTGLLGVSPMTGSSTFEARIKVNKKRIYLGSFKTPELAHQAYLEAKRKYHTHGTI